MDSTQASLSQSSSSEASERARQIGGIAWAVFFIWIGAAMLAEIPWGWFLVGVATVILAAQFARWQLGMAVEGFWVACGAVFLAGGLWNILELPWPLAPLLLIAFGLVLLGKVISKALRSERGP